MSGDESDVQTRADTLSERVADELAATVYYFEEELNELLQATCTTEKALVASRAELRRQLDTQYAQLVSEWQQRLEGAGFGPFGSRERVEAFIHETSGYLDDELTASEAESVRLDVFWRWVHFNGEKQDRHGIELSELATVFSRYGSVVALYALFETTLQELCRIAQRRRRSKIALEDLARGGKGGLKERIYLEKVHAIEVDPGLWEALAPLVVVRNRIAHGSGCVAGQRSTREIAILTSTPGLRLQGDVDPERTSVNGRLLVEPEFLTGSTRAIQALLHALKLKLSDWDRLRPVRR